MAARESRTREVLIDVSPRCQLRGLAHVTSER